MSASSEDDRSPRLNPFAFPSDTDFRFVLLVVSVLGSCLYMYDWLFNVLPGAGKGLLETAKRCAPLAPRASDAGAAIEGLLGLSVRQTPQQASFLVSSKAYSDCIGPYNQSLAVWMIGGVALVWALAFAIYWLIPRWKTWRGRLTPMTTEDVPEVLAYLGELSTEAGLSRTPTFVWNPLSQSPTGVAFGRLGRYYVALTGGLVRTFYTDRPLFRGVMLHELAHLRNADVDKTYLSVAVTISFILAALTPFLLVLARSSLDTLLELVWRVGALIALVGLSFCAVLRARETYADVRASTWDGKTEGLSRVLAQLPRPPGGWRRLLQLHPDPQERTATLRHTDGLFRIDLWQTFATGLAVAIAAPNVHNLLYTATIRTQQATLAPLLTGLVFGPLVVGTVGLQIWRAMLAARARSAALPRVGTVALALAAGLALGQPLSLRSVVTLLPETSESSVLALSVLWGGLTFVGLVLFLRWMRTVASAWLDTALDSTSSGRSYVGALIVGGGVLGVWLGVLFFVNDVAEAIQVGAPALASVPLTLLVVVGVPPIAWYILPEAITLLAVVSIWALPLAAWMRRPPDRSPAHASWAFLDAAVGHPPLAPTPRFSLNGALRTAILAGVVFAGLLLTLRIGSRLAVSAAVRDSDQYKVGFYLSWLALAILIEVGVAAIVASRAAQLPVPRALFAASVAGSLMTAVILGLNPLFGGTLDAMFAAQTLWLVIAGGALLVLPTAVLGAWLGQPRQETSIEPSADSALEPIRG